MGKCGFAFEQECICGIACAVWIGGLEIKVRCLILGLQRSMLDIILSPRVSLCRHRAFCSPRLLVAVLSFHTQFFLVFYMASIMRYCNIYVTVVFLGLIPLDQS